MAPRNGDSRRATRSHRRCGAAYCTEGIGRGNVNVPSFCRSVYICIRKLAGVAAQSHIDTVEARISSDRQCFGRATRFSSALEPYREGDTVMFVKPHDQPLCVPEHYENRRLRRSGGAHTRGARSTCLWYDELREAG